MTTAIADPWEGLPDDLKLEMMLEMLVDDELAEGQRTHLLRTLDAMPERWRDLAVRFLERQTEHASVKQFIAQAVAAPQTKTGNFKFPVTRTPLFRIAAGLLILAGITGAVLFINASSHHVDQVASVNLPGNVLGASHSNDLSVKVVPTDSVSNSLMPGDLKSSNSRELIILPQDDGKAAIIPATTEKNHVIY